LSLADTCSPISMDCRTRFSVSVAGRLSLVTKPQVGSDVPGIFQRMQRSMVRRVEACTESHEDILSAYSFSCKSQMKCFRTHVNMDIFSYFGTWNSYPKFVRSFPVHSIYSWMIVALYSCETWSLTWREVHRLRVFDNKVVKNIFGTNTDINGGCRKLHMEESRNSYSSRNMIRMIKSRCWDGQNM
jgi:hypothetical protein